MFSKIELKIKMLDPYQDPDPDWTLIGSINILFSCVKLLVASLTKITETPPDKILDANSNNGTDLKG
jgi:hypothetical protein